MWNDIDPQGLLDLYNKKPGSQFLDKSLMGMECRYGGGGGGGGVSWEDQIKNEINAYNTTKKNRLRKI